MKNYIRILFAILALSTLNSPLSTADAQGTAFTYQGQLQSNGSPVSGTYNLTFTLFATNSGGTAVASPVTNSAVAVSNGLFTVTIDFGLSVWNGRTNWLEIGVETNNAAAFTTLVPRQQVTPTPYAIAAERAFSVDGTILASLLTSFGNSDGGSGNFFIGSAGSPVTSGSDNTANGVDTFVSNTTGNYNTANGENVLEFNTSGSYNTANGYLALNSNTSGSDNTANGAQALQNNTTGFENTANGEGALYFNTNGSQNTADGLSALGSNKSGSDNIALGYEAGYEITTGSSNIDIGNEGLSTDTNIIRIGNGQSQTYIAGVINGNGGGLTNLNLAQSSGAISLLQLPAAVVTNNQPTVTLSNLTLSGTIYGDGGGLTNLNAAALGGLSATNFWLTSGNTGTSPTNGNFLGTADNQPFEIRVGGLRGWRVEPDGRGDGAANLIGGYISNAVQQPFSGADVIAGGGYYAGLNIISSNSSGNFIGAGSANLIGPYVNNDFIGGGGLNIIQSGNSAIVAGTSGTIASNAPSATIGGGNGNVIGQYSTGGGSYSMIGGGNGNTIDEADSFIGGGQGNFIQVFADHSVIGGGGSNQIAGTTGLSYGVIAGGYLNTIQTNSSYDFIGGGSGNTASGQNVTVGGGTNNTASASFATVGGGSGNTASGGDAAVAGGSANTASGEYTIVGGGDGNKASASYDTIGGGGGNTASSPDGSATVSGGYQNTASGDSSTVPGGYNNTASGSYSFAAGSGAKAQNYGSYVWSDGSAITTSTANNQFMVRASGGVIIYSSSGTSSGVSLAPGSSSWSILSDRSAKNNFAAVNPQAVLASVASLPMSTWSYKTEKGVKHLGPMAQDFYAAFCVGEDERHISTVDEGGVALAAIQGLNQKLEEQAKEKDAENAELKRENNLLATRLDNLEAEVKALAQKN